LAVNETSDTTPAGDPPQPPDGAQPAGPEIAGASAGAPGFAARGRVRRRARFLRKARELAYRDLGGLVFNLHRFGQRNDALVLNKLGTLEHIDAELRTLETALGERDTVTVLREAGITACPRCAAIHSSDDRFCPNCGLSMGRHVELPIAGSPAANVAPSPVPGASPAGAPAAPTGPAPPPPGPASVSGPALTAGAKPTPAGGSAPAPAPAVPPAAGRDRARAPAPSSAAKRSPTPAASRDQAPPTGPAPAAASQEERTDGPAPAAASEEQRTEILHPLEPDR
jgi:hypothetical protein